jgi:hypothetical protein
MKRDANKFSAWYTVGCFETRSLAKARELQAKRGGQIRRHVQVGGRVETTVV